MEISLTLALNLGWLAVTFSRQSSPIGEETCGRKSTSLAWYYLLSVDVHYIDLHAYPVTVHWYVSYYEVLPSLPDS